LDQKTAWEVERHRARKSKCHTYLALSNAPNYPQQSDESPYYKEGDQAYDAVLEEREVVRPEETVHQDKDEPDDSSKD